ncbi:MAG TPA: hypothetical protein VK939_17675 [Longimicrobiales bacterium]|nr:hypothetical protein [Longimicrobiales bacterium]
MARFPRVPAVLVSLLALSVTISACDQPQPTEPMGGGGFELAATLFPNAGFVECSDDAGATVKVTVKGSDKKAAVGAVVTAVDPGVEGGNRCWGTTNSSGVIEFRNLPATGVRFFTVRTEVNDQAPKLEIIPPPPTSTLDLKWDPTGTRNAPMIVGGAKCNQAFGFSWANMLYVADNPCQMAQTKSFSVTLPKANAILFPHFKDLNGNDISGIVVAALSGAAFQTGTFDADAVDFYCDALPFLNQTECASGVSHGAAFTYAMTETGASGKPPTGLAVGPGPILIEAVGELDGAALFGTFEAFSDGGSMVLEPGICRVDEATDLNEPAGSAAVDMQSSYYGIGLTLGEVITPGGLVSSSLDAVPTTLLLKLLGQWNGSGGTGETTFTYRATDLNGQYTVRAAFQVTDAACTVTAWSGSGLLPGVAYNGFCSRDATTKEFTLVFQLYRLPPLASATWSAKTFGTMGLGNDNFDTSRADLTAAGLPFDVHNKNCDLQLNTDGRLVPTS